jgi:type II secretory pathway pseudopilin PulG
MAGRSMNQPFNSSMESFSCSRPTVFRPRRNQEGYILLTLLLLVTLLIVGMAVIVPTISFEIRRDREQELIHRGVQYSRAIRAYYKKFGRYPTKIDDLESANNLRFLRKRYKDPVTGQDFKLLHFGEVKLSFSGGIGGGTIPGASPVNSQGGLNGGTNGSGPNGSAFGGSGFGSSGSAGSAFGGGSGFGGSSMNGPGGASQSSSFGSNSGQNPTGGFGANSNSQTPSGQQPTNQTTDSSQSGAQNPQTPGTTPGATGAAGDQLSGQVFGGGPIVGVVSTSPKATIREFNHKKKYNEWQFIYDPATDRGGLLSTPNQPPLQGAGMMNGQGTQQPGGPNTSPFGTSPGNSPNPPGNGGFGNPTPPPPPTSPQQQQQ